MTLSVHVPLNIVGIVFVGMTFKLKSVSAVVLELLDYGGVSRMVELQVSQVHPWFSETIACTVKRSVVEWAHF